MIVIGDVHGCYKTLMALIKQFPKDQKLCFVGDLIDRGKNSKEVLDFVLDNRHDCVMGNHEEMMLYYTNQWDLFGGKQTRESIGEENLMKYAQRVKLNFPIYKIYEDEYNYNTGRKLMVCHAGQSRKSINDCIKYGLITWGTEGIYNNKEVFQIVGHRPVKQPVVTEYWANIDTGCVFSKWNKLTALQFPEMIIYQQKNIED